MKLNPKVYADAEAMLNTLEGTNSGLLSYSHFSNPHYHPSPFPSSLPFHPASFSSLSQRKNPLPNKPDQEQR